MGSSAKDLTPLQREILSGFFARESGYFLTGGGALVGFHLHHRETDDLDLFTNDDAAFERGRAVLQDLARALGAEIVTVQDAPGFQRHVITRGDASVVLGLVREQVAQCFSDVRVGIVRVDVPAEILINKLTTIVSRAEERDLVDLMLLERSGLRVEEYLDAANDKDGGCTPAALAWVLSQVDIPDEARLPAGIAPRELREYVQTLVRRLRKAAFPPRI